jgi:signal transduction histidine kinase/ActR/RegA family two-component response regulator
MMQALVHAFIKHNMSSPANQSAVSGKPSERRDVDVFRADEMALIQSVSAYGLIANAAAAILVSIALLRTAGATHVLIWLACMLTAIAIRYLLHRAYGRAQDSLKEDSNWGGIVAGSNFLIGCAWGWIAFAFFSAYNPPHNIALLAALAVAAASAQTISPSRESLTALLGPALLPLMVRLMVIDPVGFAAPTLLIVALLLTVWFSLNRYRARLAASIEHFERRGASDAAMIRGAETANRLFAQVVTERERAEAELKVAKQAADDANQAKGEFLAYTSHEIRTPLNAIIGFSDVLMTSSLDNTQQDYSRRIKNAGTRLLTLINDLLDLSKIEAGKLNIEYADFELRQTLDEVVQEQAVKAREKQIALVLTIDDNVPDALIGDSLRLRQIVLNLIGNAIKFTPAQGKVTTRAQVVGRDGDRPRVRFSVTDTGIGIPPDKLGGLFARYAQADASTARKYGGTGLGLSICKSLVELMEGNIGVTSEAGKGSEFSFELPFRIQDAAVDPLPVQADIAEISIEGMRILVAEDNEHNQLLIDLLLKKQGIQPVMVDNGVEALENLRQNSYDLVFMDLEMPVMGGFDAVATIREDEKKTGRHVSIVALSAHSPEEQRAPCIAAGMDDYLMKPFDAKALQAVLRRFAPMRKAS